MARRQGKLYREISFYLIKFYNKGCRDGNIECNFKKESCPKLTQKHKQLHFIQLQLPGELINESLYAPANTTCSVSV